MDTQCWLPRRSAGSDHWLEPRRTHGAHAEPFHVAAADPFAATAVANISEPAR